MGTTLRWEGRLFVLFAALSPLALAQSEPARVAKPVVTATLNGKAVLSCDSNGVPLNVCLMVRVRDSSRTFTITPGADREGVDLAGEIGFAYAGNGLTNGQCGIRIKNVTETDNGKWLCALYSNGTVRTGEIVLEIMSKFHVNVRHT